MLLSPKITKSLELTSIRLAEIHTDWLVGGSCGLLLQGVQLTAPPRDLDIYVDGMGAAKIHEALKPYATDQLELNETDIYVSQLSHYQMESVVIEVVGGFEVKAEQSNYHVEVSDLLAEYAVTHILNEISSIRLMPLAHELLFNVLRNRPDRYHAIAETILSSEKHKKLTKELLQVLLQRNSLAPHVIQLLQRLLAIN